MSMHRKQRGYHLVVSGTTNLLDYLAQNERLQYNGPHRLVLIEANLQENQWNQWNLKWMQVLQWCRIWTGR